MSVVSDEVPSNREEAVARARALLTQARANISEFEKLADKWYITDSFSPAYGMGGSYHPVHREDSQWKVPQTDDEHEEFYEKYGDEYYDYGDEADDGWRSSSASC